MLNLLRDLLAGAVVLGILVLAHEWAHFIVAKLCGVRVDVFSIGFGPRIWGVKRGDTDYRLSVLPLGGYVRMAGDNPVEPRTGAAYEFLSRLRWQRSLVAVAGPVMNVLLAFAILWGIYAFAGMPVEAYLRQPANVAAVPQSSAISSGVNAGDRIVQVNGVETPTWEKVLSQVADAKPGDSLAMVVLRNGSRQNVNVKLPAHLSATDSVTGYPALPVALDEIEPGSPARKAGLKPGDTITSINGAPIVTWPQMVDEIQHLGGHAIHFVVRRDGKDVPLDITPKHSMNPDNGQMMWVIGAGRSMQESYEHQGVVASVQDAAAKISSWMRIMGDILAGIFRGNLSTGDLAGPVGIVQLSGQAAKAGPVTFLVWIAYISLNLGLLNLLPIPLLDGGHILMFAIEGTLRRDLSVAFKERFVQVGIIFFLGVLVLVTYGDILRWIPHH